MNDTVAWKGPGYYVRNTDGILVRAGKTLDEAVAFTADSKQPQLHHGSLPLWMSHRDDTEWAEA